MDSDRTSAGEAKDFLAKPNPARIYDYLLGGDNNFEVDRAAAKAALAAFPEGATAARENRAFLQRAVRYLVGEAGVDQFLDVGSGLPTQGPVHEIAWEVNPDARVVYVDNDPLVHSYSATAAHRWDPELAAVVTGDLRDPKAILADPVVAGMLDFDRPVGVLLVAVLHFLSDADDPAGIVARLRDAVPSGSYLALSHGASDGVDPELMALARSIYRGSTTPDAALFRSHREILALFDGWELVDPGLVPLDRWRPIAGREATVGAVPGVAGVARKP